MSTKIINSPALDYSHRKCVGLLPLFDPLEGIVVVEPPGKEEGFWAGGSSATFDERTNKFYLSYRVRTKLMEHGLQGRGGETVGRRRRRTEKKRHQVHRHRHIRFQEGGPG